MRNSEQDARATASLTTVIPRTLSVEKIAQALDVTSGHIYALIREGNIPALPGLGRRRVVAAWRLDAFLATGDWDHPDFRPHAATPPAA